MSKGCGGSSLRGTSRGCRQLPCLLTHASEGRRCPSACHHAHQASAGTAELAREKGRGSHTATGTGHAQAGREMSCPQLQCWSCAEVRQGCWSTVAVTQWAALRGRMKACFALIISSFSSMWFPKQKLYVLYNGNLMPRTCLVLFCEKEALKSGKASTMLRFFKASNKHDNCYILRSCFPLKQIINIIKPWKPFTCSRRKQFNCCQLLSVWNVLLPFFKTLYASARNNYKTKNSILSSDMIFNSRFVDSLNGSLERSWYCAFYGHSIL